MNGSWRDPVTEYRLALQQGRIITQDEILQLTAAWLGHVKPRGSETEELLVVDNAGRGLSPEVLAPRWLCHLLGLRHACAHVLLLWDSPQLGPSLVCQVRSWDKQDFPGHVDISVGGHVVGKAGPEATAWAEMQQELGLDAAALINGELIHVGGYAHDITQEETHFYDAEWRDVFVGRVESLDAIRFVDGEVTAMTLCPLSNSRQMLAQKHLPIANGLKGSLPLCLDFWESGHAV